MEAIVLAGGLGTRLQSVIKEIPKPMAPIGNQPFLYYILKWLGKNGIKKTILSVGYKWEVIHHYFHKNFDSMELVYSIEDTPLGTGGAIALAMEKLTNEFFYIINGDTFFDIDLKELSYFHRSGNFDFSIGLKPMTNFSRYGTVEKDSTNRIVRFNEKKPTKEGFINGGIYLTNGTIKKYFPVSDKFSFENDFLEKVADKLSLGGMIADKYFIDIGIPEDYMRAQTELPSK